MKHGRCMTAREALISSIRVPLRLTWGNAGHTEMLSVYTVITLLMLLC